jgi:hypothetical protein
MNTPLHREYFELLKNAREHLSSVYPKGSYILAEKENWEALRQAIIHSKQNEPQPAPTPKPPVKAPSPIYSTPQPRGIAQVSAAPTVVPKPMPVATPQPKRVVEEKIDRTLTLSEAPLPQDIDFKSWKGIFEDKFPQIALVEPAQAKVAVEKGIVIVHGSISPQESLFLQNVARTCHLLLGPTIVQKIEDFKPAEGGSEIQKMIVCYGVSVDGAFPLEELSAYTRNPAIKAQLWRQLSGRFMQKSS